MIGVAAPAALDSTERLVAQAVGGDEVAFAAIVRRHHDDMVRVSFVVTGDPDIAEEAVAAAWPIAWRRLGSLRDPDRLQAWLCSVAANEARQLVRSRARRRVREVPVETPMVGDLSADPSSRITDLDLANALARLAPDERALLALRYVAGLNATELGRATGMSASGTRARLARLLARLRQELGS